jgi:branched-chain amino acid transport system substrate-binding protein
MEEELQDMPKRPESRTSKARKATVIALAGLFMGGSVAACASSSNDNKASTSSGSSGGSSSSTAAPKGDIVIGTIQPLTGPFKFYGDWAVPAINAAIDKVNASGGINGRKLKLAVSDGGCTSGAQGVTAAREVINQKGAIALTSTQCGVVVSAFNDTILKGTKVVNISATGSGANSSADATDPDKVGYSYYFSPNTSTQAVDALTWAYGDGKLAPKKLGVLAGTDNYGSDALKGVDAYVKANNLPAPVIQRIDETATDASVQVAKLKAAGVDTIVCGCYPPPTTALLRGALQRNWHPNVLGALASSGRATFQALPEAAYKNFYGTYSLLNTQDSPELKAKLAEYQKYDPKVTLDGLGYIGEAEILFEYIKRAGKDVTPDAIANALYSGPVDSWAFGQVDIKKGSYPQVVSALTIIKYEKAGSDVKQVAVGRGAPKIDIPGIYKVQ